MEWKGFRMNAPIDEFREAMERAGITPPRVINCDGRLHRFASNGKRGDWAGYYVFHPDGVPAGMFGCWRTGKKVTWCSKHSRRMTDQERAAHKARLEMLRQQWDQDEQKQYEAAAQRAVALWDSAQAAPSDHPYLVKKRVPANQLRVYRGDLHIRDLNMNGALLVPVQDESGKLWSLQFICEEGAKLFLPGGRKRGCLSLLGDLAKIICIVEGYATGASVYAATGTPVVVAFDAGNLKPVAEAIRRTYPHTRILICGDCDASGIGQAKANDAARVVGGIAVLPETAGDDWNDVHRRDGLDAVRASILKKLNTTQTSPPSQDIGFVKVLADTILRTNHFAKDPGGALYVYKGGVYRPRGEEIIAREVKRLLEQRGETKHWSSHRAREVTEFIRVDALRLWERPPADTLNLANGLLDIKTRTLREHSPEYLSSIQLPVAYDPAATCPLWESFIARILPDDCQILPYELVASAMCGDIADQKAILLVGSGENGKSTLLNAIVEFLGQVNVSALALHRLETDKFASVRLQGKLANVCGDLPSDHLSSTSTFKALTGGDTLLAERKFQESFEFNPFARLIFSTNHYPQSRDSSQAFFRRWVVIPFEAIIEPHERDPYLSQKLSTPTELSGVLNRALAVLPGLRQRGGFTDSESTRAAMKEFRDMTDPVAGWLDYATILRPEEYVSRKDLLIAYHAHAVKAGRPPMSQRAFCESVRRLRPMVKDAQRTVGGTTRWVFLGLAMANSISRESHESRHSHHSSQISHGNSETEESKTRKE